MKIKKLILLLFVLISLNSFYQPVQISNVRTRNAIVRQINIDEDKLTGQMLDENSDILFSDFISMKLQVMVIDRYIFINNTS
jgi:hypothetical protein